MVHEEQICADVWNNVSNLEMLDVEREQVTNRRLQRVSLLSDHSMYQ